MILKLRFFEVKYYFIIKTGDGKWGQRHLLILMISICYMVMFMCRYSFPVTLIGMVQGGKKKVHNLGFDD